MAEATTMKPLLPGLPNEITIWEILARLPTRAVLRSRAVSPAWRCATSSGSFLLAHHQRQPSFPLLEGQQGNIWDLVSLDLRAGLAAAELKPTLRYNGIGLCLEASCDGLLVISNFDREFLVTNPATREVFNVPVRRHARVLGLYLHAPSGEYRLLLNVSSLVNNEDLYEFSVLALGYGKRRRYVECPFAERLASKMASVDLNGRVHWYSTGSVLAFDKISEGFSQIKTPMNPLPSGSDCSLIKFEDKLGLFIVEERPTLCEVWVLKDYSRVTWACKFKINLPVHEYRGLYNQAVVVSASGLTDLSVLLATGEIGGWFLQIDTSGNLVARINRRRLLPTGLLLKDSLVRHAFFRDES